MKKIIAAIDFSKTSLNALEYSLMLARKAGADVLMVWVDNTTSDESVVEENPVEIRKEKVNLFKELQKKYKDSLPDNKIEYKTRKGKVYTEIANLSRSMDCDMIVTGTHGVSGFEEFWIGSNAYRIVTHAPVPVVTLRLDYHTKDIKSLVLPIDSSQETRQKVPFAATMAELFNSKIHVLSLYTTNFKSVRKRVDNYAEQAINYLKEKKIKHTLEALVSDNVTKTTIDYATKVEADLIAIMTEQETTTANLFLGPYAQQMVNHSPIPILSVRSKELERIPVK